MLFSGAILINLDTQKDKFERMKSRLFKLGIPVLRFPGIVVEDKKNFYTAGALGCYLSHWECIKLCHGLDTNLLILEDDIIFRDDFNSYVDKLEKEIHLYSVNWDRLVFETYVPSDSLIPVTDHLFKSRRSIFHAGAYIINHKSVDKYLEIVEKISTLKSASNWDTAIHYFDKKMIKLVVKPLLAIQEPGISLTEINRKKNKSFQHIASEYSESFDFEDFVRNCSELQTWNLSSL